MRKSAFFCLALLLLLPACNQGGSGHLPATDSAPAARETVPFVSGENKPTEDAIRAMLEDGRSGVYWAVDEADFARSDPVTVYSASPFEGHLWDTLFPDVEVVSQEKFDDVVNMAVLIDGQEFNAAAFPLEIEFYRMPARPALLEPSQLLPALSDLTGTEWSEEPPHREQETTKYLCQVDGLFIDDRGYFVGEMLYCGPSVDMSDSNIGICVTLTLGAAAESISASDLVGPGFIKAVCTAYDQSAFGEFKSQFVMVYETAELRYYYEGSQRRLLPAFVVYGTNHYLDDEGRLIAYPTSMLIDAQTGAIIRGG